MIKTNIKRGTMINTDHCFVIAQMKIRVVKGKQRREEFKKYNLVELKNTNVREKYEE